MSIIHFDTTSAAAAGALQVGFPAGATPPFSSVDSFASANPWSAYAQIILYGETGDADEGMYITIENGSEGIRESWLDPTDTVADYYIRTRETSFVNEPNWSIGGQQVLTDGIWTGYRTDWQSLAASPPHVSIDTNTDYEWTTAASYGIAEGAVYGVVELGKLNGLIETFDAADVSTGANTITITGHGFSRGDQVVLTLNGGTAPGGISDNEFLTIFTTTVNTIQFATNLSDATAPGTVAINLTTQGTGTGHQLQRIEAVIEVDWNCESTE